MKVQIILVLTAFVCCNCSTTPLWPSTPAKPSADDPVKDRLLKSVAALDARVKTEIQKLRDEKREHLALALQEEEKRVDQIAEELKTATGAAALRLLEEELVRVERRVATEEILLERESKAQDVLLANAKALKEYVAEEIRKLLAVTGRNRNRAHQIAQILRRDEQRLEVLAQELTRAQTARAIGIYEVELRAIEVRIAEELRRLGFIPPPVTVTAAPVTRPSTAQPSTARPSTAQPSTARPSTAQPSTARPSTARPSTAQPSTARPSTARPSTVQPSTARPSTAKPSTAQPSTARPSTAQPSTARPSTARPSTAQPSTARPSTARPSTAQPSTARPSTARSSSTGSSTVRPSTELPTGAEMKEKATKLKNRIETTLKDLENHPEIDKNQTLLLKEFQVELKELDGELSLSDPELIERGVKQRLDDLKNRVEKELSRLESKTKGTTPGPTKGTTLRY